MTETISRLMEANLLGVFNERNAGRRAAMINTIYSPDVRWTDDEGSTVGREALDAKATALQSQMQGLVFTKAGPVYETLGLGYMAFELGPPGGEPVVCGFDVAVVRNGLIFELYTVITDGGPGNTLPTEPESGDGPSQRWRRSLATFGHGPPPSIPEAQRLSTARQSSKACHAAALN
jgi:hypothetical protein